MGLVFFLTFGVIGKFLSDLLSMGIDALGGSGETFFGKNKGKSIESRMKKWTWICLIILAVFSIAFFVVQQLPW